jgi:hypothetical protein
VRLGTHLQRRSTLTFGSLLLSLITTPIELVKIREQLDVRVSASARPSTLQVVRAIWTQHGIRGLYRGFGVTCLRDVSLCAGRPVRLKLTCLLLSDWLCAR